MPEGKAASDAAAVGGASSSAGPLAAPPGLGKAASPAVAAGVDVNSQLHQINIQLRRIMKRLDDLEADKNEKEKKEKVVLREVVGTPIVGGQVVRKG